MPEDGGTLHYPVFPYKQQMLLSSAQLVQRCGILCGPEFAITERGGIDEGFASHMHRNQEA